MKKIGIFFLLFVCFCPPIGAAPQSGKDLSGVWVGEAYFSKVTIYLHHFGDVLFGRANVSSLGGKEVVYHAMGSNFNNEIHMEHGAGHIFKGNLTEDNKIAGTVTTKGGHRINIEFVQTSKDKTKLPYCEPLSVTRENFENKK